MAIYDDGKLIGCDSPACGSILVDATAEDVQSTAGRDGWELEADDGRQYCPACRRLRSGGPWRVWCVWGVPFARELRLLMRRGDEEALILCCAEIVDGHVIRPMVIRAPNPVVLEAALSAIYWHENWLALGGPFPAPLDQDSVQKTPTDWFESLFVLWLHACQKVAKEAVSSMIQMVKDERGYDEIRDSLRLWTDVAGWKLPNIPKGRLDVNPSWDVTFDDSLVGAREGA